MNRLKKLADRPRENRKKVEFLLKIGLEVDNFHGDATEDLEKFKQWIAHTFTEWDSSILQYFLYEYGLLQDGSDDKYYLDFRIESILEDDTQSKLNPKIEDNLEDNVDKNNDSNKDSKLSDSVKKELEIDDEE